MSAGRKGRAGDPQENPAETDMSHQAPPIEDLQGAVAAANRAVLAAEEITARASRIHLAVDAAVKSGQIVAATREMAVASAQEQAQRAIASAETTLANLVGNFRPGVKPVAPAPAESADHASSARQSSNLMELALETTQQQADLAIAAAEDAVSAIGKSIQEQTAAFDRSVAGDGSAEQQALEQTAEAQRLAMDAAQELASQAMAAAEAEAAQALQGTSAPQGG